MSHAIRVNITLDEKIIATLKPIHNRSRFIAEAIKEKMKRQNYEQAQRDLSEAYTQSYLEDAECAADWYVPGKILFRGGQP